MSATSADAENFRLCFIFTVVMLLIGTIQLGWYINEIAALFIIMM
ncbi:MAG: hypothetical protein ACLSA6_20330 [Holdemania massiliensis]